MLSQIIYKKNDGSDHRMMRQFSDGDLSTGTTLRELVGGLIENHPVPEGYHITVHNEKSEHFVWAVDEHEPEAAVHGRAWMPPTPTQDVMECAL